MKNFINKYYAEHFCNILVNANKEAECDNNNLKWSSQVQKRQKKRLTKQIRVNNNTSSTSSNWISSLILLTFCHSLCMCVQFWLSRRELFEYGSKTTCSVHCWYVMCSYKFSMRWGDASEHQIRLMKMNGVTMCVYESVCVYIFFMEYIGLWCDWRLPWATTLNTKKNKSKTKNTIYNSTPHFRRMFCCLIECSAVKQPGVRE